MTNERPRPGSAGADCSQSFVVLLSVRFSALFSVQLPEKRPLRGLREDGEHVME